MNNRASHGDNGLLTEPFVCYVLNADTLLVFFKPYLRPAARAKRSITQENDTDFSITVQYWKDVSSWAELSCKLYLKVCQSIDM